MLETHVPTSTLGEYVSFHVLFKVSVLQAGAVAILHANCVRIEWFQKFCQNHIIYLIIA